MPTRRDVLRASATAWGVAVIGNPDPFADAEGRAAQDAATRPAAFAGRHPIVPLPFKPDALRGISEKLIVSHHDNNYAGAVKNLNKVEADLASLTKDAPPFVVGGLKQAELQYRNSAT